VIASREAGRLFRLLASAAAACTFVVIVASAIVRHSQYDVRCLEWPACAVRSSADPRQPAANDVTVARISHRFAATVAALLVVGMLVFGRNAQRRAALVALALVVALAVFGAATAESRSPLVALGNLVGGYAMLTVLIGARAFAAPSLAAPAAARTAAAAALLFVFVEASQIALLGGALPLLPLLHRGIAIGCAVLVLATAWPLRQERALAAALVVVFVALAATGIAGTSVAIAVAHNASAAVLAALLAHVVARGFRPLSGSDSR
jgi:heme A synthase